MQRWQEGLSRTRKQAFGRIANLLGATEIDSTFWDDLEGNLIQADLGIPTATAVISSLQSQSKIEGWTKASDLAAALRNDLLHRLDTPPEIICAPNPFVILVVGVNGSGKTTSVAKLGKRFISQGKSVLLAAADTYRAAAGDQLRKWAEELQTPVITGQEGGDPGAVAYDAVQSAVARNTDILIIDTAGRLHTRYNLMEELKKVHRVTGKALPGAPHAVWLVMDATTGQNALQQADSFKDAVAVTGIILAKLDSSARGGMAFAIQEILDIPILFVGLGENSNDLDPFEPERFVDGILAPID
jgi:fused signal recognition particle receptor